MKNVVLMFLLSVIIWFGCRSESGDQTAQTAKETRLVVRTAPVQSEEITRDYTLFGEAQAFKEVDVFPRISGIAQSKAVGLGTRVEKGQLLATVKQDIPGMEFALYQIESPMFGVLTMDALEVGATVSPQRAVFRVSQQHPLAVQLNIPETLVNRIRIGQKLQVKFEAFPQKTFNGDIYEISPFLNQSTRSLAVRVKIDNPESILKPGMFAKAFLNLDRHQGLTIPLDALVRSGARRYVFIVQDGVAQKIPVQTGVIFDNRIEITSGLSEGDRIVVFGQSLLDDGMHVQEEE